jgi:hypothetical protein
VSERIAEWLSLFFGPEDVFEVRALDVGQPGRKSAGWFLGASVERAAEKIADIAQQAGGVYFTPNPASRDCYKRAAGCLVPVYRDKKTEQSKPRLTHDDDITARRYLLIDVDPIRPAAFKKHSATDAEKAAAGAIAANVREYLAAAQWPTPLVIDSGNGVHLYYRLTTPLPGGSADSLTDPLAVLLRCLKSKFDTDAAEIDPAVFNASRIMKVPGTPARKGPPTTDRPHRISQVIEVPGDWTVGPARDDRGTD